MKHKHAHLAVLLLAVSGSALGASTGDALPWDTAIGVLSASFTGPWAYGVSLVALVGAFATLAFSNDLSGAGKTLAYLTIAIAGLVLVTRLITDLFGGAAATGSMATMQMIAIFALLTVSTVLAALQYGLARLIKRVRYARRGKVSQSLAGT